MAIPEPSWFALIIQVKKLTQEERPKEECLGNRHGAGKLEKTDGPMETVLSNRKEKQDTSGRSFDDLHGILRNEHRHFSVSFPPIIRILRQRVQKWSLQLRQIRCRNAV